MPTGENKNTPTNGWTEYGRLVLSKLETLTDGQDKLRRDMDDRFREINDTLTKFKSTESEVKELKEWKNAVTEVWSPTQMKEAKDELYTQKSKWAIVVGVGLAVQVVWAFVLFFKDKLF
jgi:hypothetical protein